MDEPLDFLIPVYSGTNSESLRNDIKGICQNIFSEPLQDKESVLVHPSYDLLPINVSSDGDNKFFCYLFRTANTKKTVGCVVCSDCNSKGIVVIHVVVCLGLYIRPMMTAFLEHQRIVSRSGAAFRQFEYSIPGVHDDCTPALCGQGFDIHSVCTDVNGRVRTVWRGF